MLEHERSKSYHIRGRSVRKKGKNNHVRKASEYNKLAMLDGKKVIKAPKIYENQIFRDVYDSKGNHDRVMDLSQLNSPAPRVIFQWSSEGKGREMKIGPMIPFAELEEIIKVPWVQRHNKTKKIIFFN
ncbi:hypothetical protein SteCoe_25129 [Stentor coeruleus]|uniref:Uncharacterized protein n=1 Tax=Stentor coeruleus TaxID=5963 RepID=A0A1R2BG31_9CILI|nr:hypothetical protein SteCoe_25129 [Stentor coeruleus]